MAMEVTGQGSTATSFPGQDEQNQAQSAAGGAGGLGGLLGGGGGGGIGGMLGGLFGGGMDPLSSLVGMGCKMLGLPPAVTDLVKVGAGCMTGDVMMAAEGAVGFCGEAAKSAQNQQQGQCQAEYQGNKDESRASCGYAHGRHLSEANETYNRTGARPAHAHRASTQLRSSDLTSLLRRLPQHACHQQPVHFPPGNRWTRPVEHRAPPLPAHCPPKPAGHCQPPSSPSSSSPSSSGTGRTRQDAHTEQELNAYQTLKSHFNEAESANALFHTHDGKLATGDLMRLSNDPCTPPDLKQAARFLLDNPDSFQKIVAPGPFSGGMANFESLQRQIDSDEYKLAPAGGGNGSSSSPGDVGFDDPAPTGNNTLPDDADPASATDATDSSQSADASSSTDDSSSADSAEGSSEISSILNDPNMSTEDKIEQILMKLSNEADDDILNVTKEIDENHTKQVAADKASKGSDGGDSKAKSTADNKANDLNMKLQQLTEKKKQIHDTLSNILASYADMAKLSIQNMGRA